MASPQDPEPSFEELIAWSMDAEPELLPHLPALFADLEELGARVNEVETLLRRVVLPLGARVLDLGCGKGAIARHLAREFGCTVEGVDGMTEFVAHAQRRAEEQGLSGPCDFVVADIREVVSTSRGYDLVCFLALGDVLGAADETVAALREYVKPGGYMLIDDAYVREGAVTPEDVVNCFDHATTLMLLGSSGDEVVSELVVDGPESEADYRSMTDAIARQAAVLAQANPALATLLDCYVQRQRDEVEVLRGPLVGALWLLRRPITT